MSIAYLTPLVQAGNTGPDLTRYALVCFGLLIGILGVAYFFKRFLADGLRRKAAQRSLRVADVLPLGGKQKLVVVRCYDRSFLLGIGEKEINSIAELDVEENAPGSVAQETTEAADAGPAPAFRATLEKVVGPELSEPAARPEPAWKKDGVLA